MALRRTNSSASPAGSALSAAMILRRTGWWMTALGWSISHAPQPPAAQGEAAAADNPHPEQEDGLQREEPDESEHRQHHARPQDAVPPRPDPDQRVEQRDHEREE